jgi:hypothetical protein
MTAIQKVTSGELLTKQPMRKEKLLYTESRYIHGLSKMKPNFLFKHLLISLQLNKACLLQSTPLHCLYTASNVFSSYGMRFAG